MADIEQLPPLDLAGHEPSTKAGADHPMRRMTRRAAGLEGPPWDAEAAHTVASLFDSLAPEWHTRESEDRRAVVDDALARGLDPLLRRDDADTVGIEVGSGLGTYSGAMASRFGVLLAVELAEEMHRLAHPSAACRVLADASRLPVADASADALALVNCFLFPTEVERVLRQGGTILWVNSSGANTPIHLSTAEVVEALPFEVAGVESTAGIATWCALQRTG